jgi:hypothetical protein
VTGLWGVAAAAALLWPDRIHSPFDGVPLDRVAEAVLVGAIFPALWWFDPRFLRTTAARVCIVVLFAWKLWALTFLVQDGWCVRFEPARPYAKDAGRVPHAWDLRADWLAFEPACSAVMTRSYRDLHEFPAWFFNLPPANNSYPEPDDRPPRATVGMQIRGYLSVATSGTFQIDTGPDVKVALSVDGHGVPGALPLTAGTHFVSLDGILTGERWAVVPRWNGEPLWDNATATLRRPSTLDLSLRPAIRWIAPVTTLLLFAMWCVSAARRIDDWVVVAWTAGMSTVLGALACTDHLDLARWLIAALAAAVLLPVSPRLRNWYGMFALVGIPWLVYVVAGGVPAIGRMRLYNPGTDEWTFQRFGYRIVMQGFWLEGGSPTFYFQPLYRWISGVLHALFGETSAGERFCDGMCLLAGAALSFRITRAFAGFRWALAAAVAPLAVFSLGTPHYLIGYGLSEISSAGLLSAAALCAMNSRRNVLAPAVGAGILATLGFYTRLNNGIMAFGVAVFALPLQTAVRDLVHPRAWWGRVSWRAANGVVLVVALGVLAFMWRTWYYTGVFSLFHGTAGSVVTIWQPDMPARMVLQRLAHSVFMVLTVNDPPRVDVYALPVMFGAVAAVLSLCQVRPFRDLPAAPVLFFVAAIAASFVGYGWEYPGRFSLHVLPITCALAMCAAARLTNLTRRPRAVVDQSAG